MLLLDSFLLDCLIASCWSSCASCPDGHCSPTCISYAVACGSHSPSYCCCQMNTVAIAHCSHNHSCCFLVMLAGNPCLLVPTMLGAAVSCTIGSHLSTLLLCCPVCECSINFASCCSPTYLSYSIHTLPFWFTMLVARASPSRTRHSLVASILCPVTWPVMSCIIRVPCIIGE